tara:strand:+ start:5814 stop:6347 length:534 start_codon:yes stop_codon:yes gene_type:complete
MKTLKDIKDIKFVNNVSELTPIESNAGWYIGKLYNDEGFLMPHSRNSEYMSRDEVIKKYRWLKAPIQDLRKKVVFNDGFSVSVQASASHSCDPKINGLFTKYRYVEVGFPNEKEELLIPYADSPMIEPELARRSSDKWTHEQVYHYVPSVVIKSIVKKHKGIKSGEMPELDYNSEEY